MYVFLFAMGLVTAAIGVFTLGFGIPNNQFSLGNTLIIAGAVALVGGLIQIGLAVIARYLRRIADALAPRATRRAPAVEIAEIPARQAAAAASPRIPFPPKPEPRLDVREPRVAAAEEAPAEEVRERPRPNILAIARGGLSESLAEEDADAVPLAPARTPAAPAVPPMFRAPEPVREPVRAPEPIRPEVARAPEPEPAAEPEPELRATQADILSRLSNLAAPPRPAARPAARSGERTAPAEPAAERPAERPEPRNMFEGIWPSESRGTRSRESVARAPRSDVRTEPRVEPRPEPRVEPRAEPRVEPRAEPPMTRATPTVAAPEPREEAPRPASVAILKSGVIDGMAYTLYTDGSIEAQLPQGIMRFASIEELRTHLEKVS